MKAFRAVLGLFLAGSVAGCGGSLYVIHVNSATSKLEEARAQGAEELAPYEYYYAREHLRQAQVEASEASYSDAIEYANTAETYAEKAIQLAQAARHATGRP